MQRYIGHISVTAITTGAVCVCGYSYDCWSKEIHKSYAVATTKIECTVLRIALDPFLLRVAIVTCVREGRE